MTRKRTSLTNMGTPAELQAVLIEWGARKLREAEARRAEWHRVEIDPARVTVELGTESNGGCETCWSEEAAIKIDYDTPPEIAYPMRVREQYVTGGLAEILAELFAVADELKVTSG